VWRRTEQPSGSQSRARPCRAVVRHCSPCPFATETAGSPHRASPRPSTRKHPSVCRDPVCRQQPVPTASYVDVYAGERLGMGSTAIGREACRVATYGAAERAPIASTPVPCRSPALQSSPVRRGDGRAGPDREHVRREPLSGITVLVRRRADGASMTEHVRRGPLSGIAVPPNEENGLTLSKRGLTPFSGGDDWELRG
jgi:hypothetical protein